MSKETTMNEVDKRDGRWIDSTGCCRVCDGEIPYGHTPDCEYYKLEQRLKAAEQCVGAMLLCKPECPGVTELADFCNCGAQVRQNALNAFHSLKAEIEANTRRAIDAALESVAQGYFDESRLAHRCDGCAELAVEYIRSRIGSNPLAEMQDTIDRQAREKEISAFGSSLVVTFLEQRLAAAQRMLALATGDADIMKANWHAACNDISDMQAKLDAANARTAELEEKLDRISQWCDAYPISVFPEPNWPDVQSCLKANGINLDAISASNMRHIVTGIKGIIQFYGEKP